MMEADDIFPVHPDRSGPRNLAVLLMLGALVVLWMGYADLQAHRIGLSDDQVSTLIATPNTQGGEPTTLDDFRAFERDARDDGAFLTRAVALLTSGGLVLTGAALLFRLRRTGAYLCTAGAAIGLLGGVGGSVMIRGSAQAHLGDALAFTYEAWVYICGAMMGLCLAMAGLPLLNLRARMALEPLRIENRLAKDEAE